MFTNCIFAFSLHILLFRPLCSSSELYKKFIAVAFGLAIAKCNYAQTFSISYFLGLAFQEQSSKSKLLVLCFLSFWIFRQLLINVGELTCTKMDGYTGWIAFVFDFNHVLCFTNDE